jgi:hypothetical protein
MRVVLLLVLLVLMSITPPTLAVTTAATTLPVEPDGGSGGQPGEPGDRPTTTATTTMVSSFSSSSGSECDPSYPDVCIPSPPPDLACSDISERRFEVVGSDPHALDGDNNGIGCEGPPPIPPTPLQAPQRQQETQEQQEQNQTETRNLTTSTTTPFITNTTTKKTDGLLTASINGTSFTTNQTILVNGTVVGGQDAPAGNNGTLYVELRDPHNETMLYETGKITTTTGGAKNESPFSYKLIAGDVHNTSSSTSQGRTVFKPMNETGANYTMAVGYAFPQSTTPSEVEFVFAYEHLLDDAAAAGGEEEPTTTSSSTTTPPTTPPGEESVIPPTPPPPAAPAPAEEEPEEDDDDEDDDDDNSDNGDDDDNGDDEDDEDDNDDSRDALEILKDVLNREPPRDVDEDDD